MSAPKSEHVAALIEAAEAGSDPDGRPSAPMSGRLCEYTTALMGRLSDDIAQNETMKRRGHQGQRKAFDIIAPMVQQYADALAAHKPISTDPACTAQNQLGVVCMRTEPGHTAHTYPPVNPTDRVSPLPQPVPDPTGIATCGMTYPGSADACLLDPTHVPKRESHQARNSRWPVSDDDLNAWSIAQPIATPIAPNPDTIAYLKGETDELGTPPLFTEPRGEITVTGTVHAPGAAELMIGDSQTHIEMTPVTPPELAYVELGLSDQIVTPGNFQGHPFTDSKPLSELLEAAVQPDPFADAGVVPDSEIRRDYSWRPEPDPRPLWLPKDYANGEYHGPISSIRVTAVRTGEQCGLAYRLISRDQVPEVPAWWNVGGHTLHECAKHLEEMIISGNCDTDALAQLDETTARAWWDHHWAQAVALTERESPGFERRHWRAANKGTEGADWWNEVGPHMVRDYAAASARWHAEGWQLLSIADPIHGDPGHWVPAMELEMRSPLPTGGELVGHLDQAWYRVTAIGDSEVCEIRIRDLKTSKEMPDDEWQLDAYAVLLAQRLAASGMDLSRATFSVVHYDARNGKDAEVRKLARDLDIPVAYRASSVLRMHEANLYPANPGTDWKAPCNLCSVRYACPIMALKP